MKLSIRQSAERSGLSISLLYQLCTEGQLTHYRVGGRGKRGCIRIDDADLEAFMIASRVTAGAVQQEQATEEVVEPARRRKKATGGRIDLW